MRGRALARAVWALPSRRSVPGGTFACEGVVVRLYESMRRRGPVTLTANFPFTEVWRANVLEDKQEALGVNGRDVTFNTNPYEIVTIRLV